MSKIHLSDQGFSATFSHFRIAQNTTAVNKEDRPYTSASTAENQNVSVNAYAEAPTRPAAKITKREMPDNSFSTKNLRAKCVIVQNKNIIVAPLATAVKILIAFAISSTLSPTKIAKNRANIR